MRITIPLQALDKSAKPGKLEFTMFNGFALIPDIKAYANKKFVELLLYDILRPGTEFPDEETTRYHGGKNYFAAPTGPVVTSYGITGFHRHEFNDGLITMKTVPMLNRTRRVTIDDKLSSFAQEDRKMYERMKLFVVERYVIKGNIDMLKKYGVTIDPLPDLRRK